MSGVFISYKSENVNRVAPLAQALEQAGLQVWWDRHLAGGESWRAQIQQALSQAKCVVVVWTHESVGPAGDFVRDEASEARSRGILVPVKLDEVKPPLGFGEIQAVDLTKWKGSTKDPFFEDLLGAVHAKIEGRTVSPAKGPIYRRRRRIVLACLAIPAISLAAFGSNMFHAQERVCAASLMQPQISDACGTLGLGSRATKQERIAWERRKPGSCSDLRVHLARFPGGAYHSAAMELLAARRVTKSELWANSERRLRLYQPQSDLASKNQAAAQAIAGQSAATSAAHLCKGFAATGAFRFIGATSAPQQWNCVHTAQGFVCGFDGEAICQLQERSDREDEICGK